MLLIYNNPATYEGWSDAERAELFAEVDDIMKELTDSGELVGGEALADASSSRTVRVRDGVVETTDGPYAEAKEQLAGYLTVDCESPERAAEIAARWPDARYFAMEVRPVIHTSDPEK
ncbi:YciI family protein [Actinomadura scrupuli]|uniref:YciI family protein n=1 Tax=Actinomadura scrupuli TaxID=559629 RepID=UPI003D95D6A8